MSDEHLQKLSRYFNYRRLTDVELDRFAEDGYLLYSSALTDLGLEEMRAQCMDAWHAEKGTFDPEGNWLKNALLGNIHHRSPLVRQYYFSGPLVEVTTQLIGPNIKAATSQLTFKLHGNTQTFSWHQDNSYGELDPYNAISCLTALDDTDQQNGCLWLVPGSHKQGQIAYTHTLEDKREHRAVQLDVDDSLGLPMPLRAGESLFFHCHMLHKSEGNLSSDRDRRILFLRYADADAVEVYNNRQPRLGRLVRGTSRFEAVRQYEADLPLS